jgi:ABC-type transport system involved in multi-copper enzyme maturation permease subunit
MCWKRVENIIIKRNRRRIIFTLIGLAVIAVIVLFIWAMLNPEHARMIIDKVFVVLFMAMFFGVGWFFMTLGKKQK